VRALATALLIASGVRVGLSGHVGGPGPAVVASSSYGYLIPEDTGVVVHVNATDLHNGVARVGPAWTLTGTVPFIGPRTTTPAQIGGFSAGHYSLPVVNPLNFVGSFSVCLIDIPASSDLAPNNSPLSNGFFTGGSVVGGFDWQSGIGFRTGTAIGGNSQISGGAETGGAMSILQFGYNLSTQTIYAQVNGAATQSLGSANYGPNSTAHALIGALSTQTFNGTVIELYATNTPPSAALFTAIYRSVKAQL
jgi:hypothetical protein